MNINGIIQRLLALKNAIEDVNDQLNPTISSGTLSYLDAGSTQTIKEVTNTSDVYVEGIFIDCSNLTQNGTLAFWTKVDGTNYRQVKAEEFRVDLDDSLMLHVGISTDKDFKFTYTEDLDEGAARAIPYKVSYQTRA